MEWINEPDFPAEIQETAINIDKALAEMEECVARLTAVPLADAQSLMKPLDKAKYDTAAIYAVTSLYWAYVNARGNDPKSLGLSKELDRVKEAMARSKQIADKVLAPKVDVAAAKRFIRSGLWEAKEDKETQQTSSTTQEDEGPSPNKRLCSN